MNCLKCNSPLLINGYCSKCGVKNEYYKKAYNTSNWYYNRGLEKAKIRDLSGAVEQLKKALKYNKMNTNARNLLGLAYYEMGEVVDALSAWVISINFQKENNIAQEYLDSIQSNPTRLNEVNQTIKKYNQTLVYANQGDMDLALIQLKRVVSMSPKFVRGHLLLALLYIKTEAYDKAKKELKKVLRIDANNTMAITYYREIGGGNVSPSRYMATSENKSKNTDISQKPVREKRSMKEIQDLDMQDIEKKAHAYRTIDPEQYVNNNNNRSLIIALLVGLLMGVIVMWILVIPQKTGSLNQKIKSVKLEYNEELSEKTKEISELKKEKSTLEAEKEQIQKELDKYTGETAGGNIYEQILEAADNYMKDDKEKAVNVLLKVDETKIEKGSQAEKTYQSMKKELFEKMSTQYYTKGYQAYSTGKYEEAAKTLEKAVELNQEHADSRYFLARAYHKLGKTDKAIENYEKVISDFKDTQRASEAEQYLNTLK